MVITWVNLAHGWKGAGYEMDGGRSRQGSIDVINTFDISAHDLVWLEVIHLSPVMSLSGNKMAQLLNAGKPSWTCAKEKESFCDSWSSLGHCNPLIATSVTFSCVGGSKSKFEGSIDDFRTAVEDINAAILGKYICAKAATVKKRCEAFLLADGGNLEHFLTAM